MANEWSQELLNEINSAGQAFEEAALSGNPRIPDSVRQQVAENVLYRYYQQQKAAREANKGRTAHSYLRDTVAENVANPVEYSTEQLQAAKARTHELSEKLDNLKATKSRALTASPYAAAAYQNIASDEEIRNTESALALAQKQQERMERDTARAKQAAQVRAVDEALERGVGYAAQYDAYSQSLKALNAEKQKLTQQLNDIRGGRAGYFGQENAEAQEKAEKDTTDRIERLEREIERIEGQRNYASLNLGKDKNAAVIIKQGEELSKNLKEVWDNNDEVMASVMGERRVARFRDKADRYHPTENWTPEQQAVYNYLLAAPNHGAEDARDYAAQINDAINRGINTAATAQYYAWGAQADGNFLQKAGATAALLPAGIAAAPSHALSWMEKIADVMQGNPYVKNAVPTLADKIGAATKGRAEQLNKDGGTVSESVPIVGGKGFGDLFQLGQSVVQSAVMGNLVGEGATLAAFFAQSADSAFDEAKARGGSDEYAAMFSTLSGLAEVLGEKISLDHMLKGGNIGSLKYILKQAGIEGTEEVNTSVLNQFFDRITANVTGDQTAIQDKISALVRQGMSYEEAEKQVWKETVEDVAWDFVGGFVSGGMSGAVQSGISKTTQKTGNVLYDIHKQQVEQNPQKISDDTLKKRFNAAMKRGDLSTMQTIVEEMERREAAPQEADTSDPDSTSKLARRMLDQLAGLNQQQEQEYPAPDNAQPTARQASLPDEFKDLNPIVAQQLSAYEGGDLETVIRSLTPQAVYRYEQYLRSIGQYEKADLLDRYRTDPTYRYEEKAPHPADDPNLRNGPQNAAGAQQAPGGQITQPSQQNAAQTVKPGDSEQKKSDSRPKLQEGHYYYLKDKVGGLSEEGLAAVKKAYSEEFERLKNGEKKFSIEAPDGSVHTILVGSAGYGNSGASWYIDPDGYRGDAPYLSRTYQGYRDGHEESKEEALAYAIEIVRFDIESDKHSGILDYTFSLPSSSLTSSTESGTMSVPNTQEVTTNAGEQAVRQSEEAAAGESDAERPVREAGEQAARGVLGEQRQDTEGESVEPETQSGTERRAPSFVTEREVREWSDTNQAEDISPEAKTKYKAILKDANDGTKVVTKPKTGSHLHFVQNFFKRLGIIDDVMLASNDSGSVFKDGSKGKENSGKIIMDANVYGEDLIPASAHEASHKKLFDHYGGVTAKDILNGSYNQRMGAFTRIFMNAFGPMNGLKMMTDVQNIIREDYGYGKQYNRERGGRVAAVNREAAKSGRTLGTDANALVKEMEQARALEEFINEIVAWDGVFIDAVEKRLNLTDEQIGDLRNKIFDEFKSSGVMTDADVQAINDFITEAQELEENGDFTDEELEGWPGFSLSDDLFDELDISESSNFGSNEERRRELAATLRTLISGDTEAIGRLSTDYLNYAINYTLKKADPDLDFKEKRRTYNAIANVLSGMNIDTFGYDRNVARNESNDKNNAGFDGMMSKAPNKLFYAVSSRTQADDYEGGRRGMDTIGNLQPGQYRPTGNAADMQTVLRNAINELDRRGLNIWGKENNNRFEYDEETDDTGKQYERSDTDSDYSSQYNSATYGDNKAEDDYSDEYNEGSESRESKLRAKDQRAAEKREATSALRRLREGDNWLEGAVKVNPEAKKWGRGAKKTAGQKTQGWYDINRRSSLAEREFARQRVMNARAAEDLSYEIQTMEDQASDIREEIELARRNSPAAKESLKMINSFLEELNDDIDDLHAIDDMFRDAVREDPNSDMTKQLATEGTRLSSEIENLRRDIDTLGRLANESIANNNSEELRDAEKRLRKQEQKIKAKREHLKKLLDESHGGNKSGALVASRAETAFDSMPDDVIKQIIRNGYVSMDMLQDYYGNADAAYQTMYEFQERVGETGKTRVPSVHKLTGLEKTALHGILADRKKAGKITSGYGGVETTENISTNLEDSEWQRIQKAKEAERAVRKDVEPKVISSAESEDVRAERVKNKYEDLPRLLSGSLGEAKYGNADYATSDEVRNRNREAYQNAMAPAGMVYEPSSGPVAANMDRLNRMFADRLGIKNKGNTAIAYGKMVDAGTWEDESVSESSDFGSNKGQEKKPLVVDAAYTNYAAAAQSVADLHKKIMSEIMADNPNAEPDYIDKQIEDSFLGNSVRALDTAVSQIANSKDPLGAVFNLRQQLYSAKNKGEGTYAALASDAVIGMCDEIGRLIENKTMPYDEKARAYAVATTQLVSALSTRAERLYEAAHRVQRIQDKLATVTKKDRGSLRQLGTGYLIKQMNPTTLFKMLDDFDVSGKGAGYEIARALENGTVKSAELIARAARQFDEAKKTEGFQEFAEGKTIAKYKLKGEYTISELQAIEFIMLARRMNGMKVYDVDAHGGVIEKTRLQTLKGFALRDADGNHIFVDSMYEDSKGKKKRFDWYKEAESMYRNLSPAAKAYMKAANKVLDGLGKEIRQTKINATGVGFSGMEGTGYYPMSYMSQKEHLPDYNTNPDYEGLSQDKHLQSVRLTHGGYAVVQNAAKTVDRYVEWASNYAAYGDIADMLLTMNTSGNGRGIVNATGDAYGAQYAKAIEKYIGDINNFTDTQKNDVVNSALRGLRQKMAAGALGLSFSVPIKQVASYWDAAGILSMDSLRRAYRFKLTHEKGLGADNMFLQSRKVGNIDPTVSEMLGSGLLDSLKKRSGIIKRFAEATNTMDYRTVDNLFTATVLDVEASLPGIDKDSDLFKRAVEAKFNQVVLNTQPIFNKNARSEYQRSSNEIERALGMFRTQQAQNLNRIITSVMEARSTKGTSLEAATKRQLRQTLAGQIAGQLEFAALTAIANTVMHGWKRWRDDDDEITMESIIKRFGLDFAESIAGTAWFGDEAAKAISDRVFGTNESFGVSAGVLSTLVDTGKYFFDIVDDLRSDDPLALFDSLRKFVGSAATVAGKPVNNVYRLANAAVMWGADILKWASKGKYGNRANYDDSMKMLDAWIKGGLKEEGAKKQAAKAFRKNQPENLLYNLGILSSLSKSDDKTKDKGRVWLDSKLKKSGGSEEGASSNQRILDYLVKQALSAEQLDKAVGSYVTAGDYDQTYSAVRATGASPKEAIDTIASVDADGNGSTTQNELWEYYKANQKKDKQVGAIWDSKGYTKDGQPRSWDSYKDEQERKEFKAVVDANGNNRLTQAELLAYYKAHPDEESKIAELWDSNGWKTSWSSYKAKNAS